MVVERIYRNFSALRVEVLIEIQLRRSWSLVGRRIVWFLVPIFCLKNKDGRVGWSHRLNCFLYIFLVSFVLFRVCFVESCHYRLNDLIYILYFMEVTFYGMRDERLKKRVVFVNVLVYIIHLVLRIFFWAMLLYASE